MSVPYEAQWAATVIGACMASGVAAWLIVSVLRTLRRG